MEKQPKTGIFLTGGGAIGSFHIGFFKALKELEIPYDCVFGCSAGAIIAGASTYLSPRDMYECWKELTLESILNIDITKIEHLKGRLKNIKLILECAKSCMAKDPNLFIEVENIRGLLYNLLDGYQMAHSKIDFGISTTDLSTMKKVNIWKEDMITDPREYILASSYMPIFTKQPILDGKHYMDLCRFRKYPLEALLEKDCDKIFVVNVEAENLRKLTVPIKKLFPDKDVTFIDYEKKPSILDFTPEQTEKNFNCGYETTMKTLEKTMKL